MEGPFYDQKTPFEKLVDTCKVATASPEELDASAEAFLRRFATSAFRGQEASDEFVSKLNTYYKAERKAGKNFLEAMVDPLAMILSSPRFLYLVNPSTERETKQSGIGWDQPCESPLFFFMEWAT